MKTAVDFIAEQLMQGNMRPVEIIAIAKQMEKEQIIEARNHGIEYTLNGYSMRSEQYYNETYKNTNDEA